MTLSTDHPDHARILAGIETIESQVTQDDLEADREATREAVRAAAVDRTNDVLENYPEVLLFSPSATLRSVWTDGFTAGVQFQRNGGHIEA